MTPDPSGSHLSVLNVLKLIGKHFIDPKRSEILSIFQIFPCTMQTALFWPKTAPCPFALKEALISLLF
jgi:hypothetical protein